MSGTTQNSDVLIIGGGIAGLTLALALARRGVPCHVFEQAAEFTEVGAGLQLSPNAFRRLEALGLGDLLRATCQMPSSILIRDGVSGRRINQIPLGAEASARYGAPYMVLARHDLQTILLTAAAAEPLITISPGKRLTHIRQDGRTLTAMMEDESRYDGGLLVGADGVWSRARHLINRNAVPVQTGFIAWRALVKAETVNQRFLSDATQVWLGPNAHLVAYRVADGGMVNLVAVTKGVAQQRSWADELPAEQLFEELRGWERPLRQAVMGIEGWSAWPLMLLKPFSPWHKGRALLIGDAAHAIVPFLAQGAAMAIEDAVLLAEMIGARGLEDGSLPAAFEAQRYKRCRRVLSKSMFNAQFYHAGGPLRPVRNFVLGSMPAKGLLRQYDWLYSG